MKNARPGSLEPQHDSSLSWRYIAPVGDTLDDVTHPEYFRNHIRECSMTRVAGRHAWNRIEVIAEDGSWEADLRIVSVDKDGLRVMTRVIREWPMKPAAVEKAPEKPPERQPPEGYTVEHIQGNGWRALDRNAAVLVDKRTTRDAALQAAVEHHNKGKR